MAFRKKTPAEIAYAQGYADGKKDAEWSWAEKLAEMETKGLVTINRTTGAAQLPRNRTFSSKDILA